MATAAMGTATARLHEVGAYRASGTRSVKTVLTGTGTIALDVPRDRLSIFDPRLIAKYQRRFPGFDECPQGDAQHQNHLDVRARHEHPRSRAICVSSRCCRSTSCSS